MTDYEQEQEMEIEALEAILMDDFKEIHSGESGLNATKKCFQITLSPLDDEADELTMAPVQLGLIFSHMEKYPDEPPLLNVRSIRGIQGEHIRILREKLQQEASENLGMAMIYTLVTSAKEWLSEQYGQDTSIEDAIAAEEAAKDDIIVPHGEPVTYETFLAWREMFEAELALERANSEADVRTVLKVRTSLRSSLSGADDGAPSSERTPAASLITFPPRRVHRIPVFRRDHPKLQTRSISPENWNSTDSPGRESGEGRCWSLLGWRLMPESALSAPKEKRLTGRQWFETGRAAARGAATAAEGSDEEDDEDIDFDDEDFEDDEDDMLEHYLAAEKSDSSTHSSRRAAN
ncbi:hypothetical protein ACLB2K_062833 [Fragaria x ananassa]